jgi:hypothetical protein
LFRVPHRCKWGSKNRAATVRRRLGGAEMK